MTEKFENILSTIINTSILVLVFYFISRSVDEFNQRKETKYGVKGWKRKTDMYLLAIIYFIIILIIVESIKEGKHVFLVSAIGISVITVSETIRRKLKKSYYCSNCGVKYSKRNNFCPSCGSKNKNGKSNFKGTNVKIPPLVKESIKQNQNSLTREIKCPGCKNLIEVLPPSPVYCKSCLKRFFVNRDGIIES